MKTNLIDAVMGQGSELNVGQLVRERYSNEAATAACPA